MSESQIDACFASLRRGGRPALIPYMTAGHPDRGGSRFLLEAADGLADIIELGVPFSDPLADGPVIQRSSFRALENGMTLAGTLELVAEVRPSCPVVLFSYLNPVLRYGMEKFLADAAHLGIAGLLFTDLPAGGDPEIETMIANSPLDLIRMVAPTTSEARLPVILDGATGFIYLVARLGVTGVSSSLDAGLAGSIERVRSHTPLPVAAGFGISTPDQVREAGRLADGVVVGSALVRKAEEDGPDAAIGFLRNLRAALPQGAGAS